MPKPWDRNWHRLPGQSFSGGQAKSFVAEHRHDDGVVAFIKTLRPDRENNVTARARFKREAGAYETLAGLGPPVLLEHNADAWRDLGTPMFLALEYIDGPSLQKHIRAGSPVGLPAALACVRELAVVLNNCHMRGVKHRDVKPANVVLRGGDITQPVLVDFGLSFNDEHDDDLTRVDEEIGNRFLRLPEHAFGGRGAASDVTQLAGVFLYLVTGEAPRVLTDESNLMPHQRPEAYAILRGHLDDRQYVRTMRVFDRGVCCTIR